MSRWDCVVLRLSVRLSCRYSEVCSQKARTLVCISCDVLAQKNNQENDKKQDTEQTDPEYVSQKRKENWRGSGPGKPITILDLAPPFGSHFSSTDNKGIYFCKCKAGDSAP